MQGDASKLITSKVLLTSLSHSKRLLSPTKFCFYILSNRTAADHLTGTLRHACVRKCRPPLGIRSQAPCYGHARMHPSSSSSHRLVARAHLLCIHILRRPSELSTQPGLGNPGNPAVVFCLHCNGRTERDTLDLFHTSLGPFCLLGLSVFLHIPCTTSGQFPHDPVKNSTGRPDGLPPLANSLRGTLLRSISGRGASRFRDHPAWLYPRFLRVQISDIDRQHAFIRWLPALRSALLRRSVVVAQSEGGGQRFTFDPMLPTSYSHLDGSTYHQGPLTSFTCCPTTKVTAVCENLVRSSFFSFLMNMIDRREGATC